MDGEVPNRIAFAAQMEPARDGAFLGGIAVGQHVDNIGFLRADIHGSRRGTVDGDDARLARKIPGDRLENVQILVNVGVIQSDALVQPGIDGGRAAGQIQIVVQRAEQVVRAVRIEQQRIVAQIAFAVMHARQGARQALDDGIVQSGLERLFDESRQRQGVGCRDLRRFRRSFGAQVAPQNRVGYLRDRHEKIDFVPGRHGRLAFEINAAAAARLVVSHCAIADRQRCIIGVNRAVRGFLHRALVAAENAVRDRQHVGHGDGDGGAGVGGFVAIESAVRNAFAFDCEAVRILRSEAAGRSLSAGREPSFAINASAFLAEIGFWRLQRAALGAAARCRNRSIDDKRSVIAGEIAEGECRAGAETRKNARAAVGLVADELAIAKTRRRRPGYVCSAAVAGEVALDAAIANRGAEIIDEQSAAPGVGAFAVGVALAAGNDESVQNRLRRAGERGDDGIRVFADDLSGLKGRNGPVVAADVAAENGGASQRIALIEDGFRSLEAAEIHHARSEQKGRIAIVVHRAFAFVRIIHAFGDPDLVSERRRGQRVAKRDKRIGPRQAVARTGRVLIDVIDRGALGDGRVQRENRNDR
ncbi:MAG: hypothetical protein BWZ10_01753 [candidate division BRC1 bacterium ADurb.BinA364]|nr:MAG: hypothetical protein BWZ10_01753 [candidate division BRC1 bacterium ADurb.BinA364]